MTQKKSMNWLMFSLMTVAFWGLYGIFLHNGAMGMKDPQFGRYKAFLVVGIAYFLVAVLAPLVLLKASGASLSMPGKGFWWALIAAPHFGQAERGVTRLYFAGVGAAAGEAAPSGCACAPVRAAA